MQFIKDNKIYIIGIAAALLGLWFYMTYLSGPASSATITTEQASPLPPEILVTLSNLHTIRLDAAIFEDPLFKSLTDYGVTLPSQNAGRANPFAPFSEGGR
jgi:hypothetical protein